MHNLVNYSIVFSIASSFDQLALVRSAMFGVLQHLTVVTEDIYDLQLAVSEILTNSMEHGHGCLSDQKVEVTLTMHGQTIEVDVVDSAPAFPVAELYRINGELEPLVEASEDWPARGHGLQIARHVIDSLRLSSEGHGNHFTLTKCVRLRPE